MEFARTSKLAVRLCRLIWNTVHFYCTCLTLAFTESTLDSITEIFYSFDLNGKFLLWNNTLESISGYSEQELSLMQPQDFFLSEDVQRVSEAIERTYKEGSSKVEAYFVLKDGRQILCDFSGSILKDSSDNIIGFTGTGRDITEKKRDEVALIEQRDLLTRQKEELEEVIAQIKQQEGLFLSARTAKKSEMIKKAGII
jgi:PAS domain S-box-containing protein